MKRLLSTGLLLLLLYHTLGYVFVFLSVRWQEQHELSERLRVYSSTDSMVEFHVPLQEHPDEATLTQHPNEGFSYRGKYFEIVHLEVSGDTLHITGYESSRPALWQPDLLSFVKKQFTGSSETSKKASQLLKLLLKEYCRPERINNTQLLCFNWHEARTGFYYLLPVTSWALSLPSPPPELG